MNIENDIPMVNYPGTAKLRQIRYGFVLLYKVPLRDAGNVSSRGCRKAKKETQATHA